MKNIQVIDGAKNCTFNIFRATDAEFALLFPEPGQEIQFADDLLKLSRRKENPECVGCAVGETDPQTGRARDTRNAFL
jgi:hypothetical protein